MTKIAKNKTVFLDRDGILVKLINTEAPRDPKDMELIPEILPVVKKLHKDGFLIIIVSNQPDIALNKINETTKNALKKRFEELLIQNNVLIDAIYYCNHHPNSVNQKYPKNCACRKPKPGMILNAHKKFNIDLPHSFMIGDRASDIKAGALVNTKTILYDPNHVKDQSLKELRVEPDYIISKLDQILSII